MLSIQLLQLRAHQSGNCAIISRSLYQGPIPISFLSSKRRSIHWRDKRGHFHTLLHTIEAEGGFRDGPKVGCHAFSRAVEGPWTFNNQTLAFSTKLVFSDGTSVEYFRRETPQLFCSENGTMRSLYLTTSVQEKSSPMTYSVIQPLKAAKEWEWNSGSSREMLPNAERS